MLIAFVITYLIARGYTRMARKTGWGSANVGGVHTHHLVFGLIIAFVSGALMFSLLPQNELLILLLAGLFGVGAALVLDEFALLFHLEDVYWKKEGRKSVDAVVLGAAFGSLLLLRVAPLNLDSDEPARLLLPIVIVNLCCVTIAALKGKVFLAIFGVFIPFLAQVGAIRLAEPNSLWARKFYKHNAKKMKSSIKRYENYEIKWRRRKELVWDLIGGKVNS